MKTNRHSRRSALPLLAVLVIVAAAGLWATFAPDTRADNPSASARGGGAARPDTATPQPTDSPAPPASSPGQTAAPEPSPTPEPSPAPEPSKPDQGVPASADKARWVDVDLSQQRVSVKDGDQVVREMMTSSGAPGYETPQGTFQIENRGEWFYSGKYEEGAKWWVSFKGWGQYLFHSIVMDENQQVIEAEAAKLGTPASHGCLRLAVDDAKWIYDNVPQGATVVIHA